MGSPVDFLRRQRVTINSKQLELRTTECQALRIKIDNIRQAIRQLSVDCEITAADLWLYEKYLLLYNTETLQSLLSLQSFIQNQIKLKRSVVNEVKIYTKIFLTLQRRISLRQEIGIADCVSSRIDIRKCLMDMQTAACRVVEAVQIWRNGFCFPFVVYFRGRCYPSALIDDFRYVFSTQSILISDPNVGPTTHPLLSPFFVSHLHLFEDNQPHDSLPITGMSPDYVSRVSRALRLTGLSASIVVANQPALLHQIPETHTSFKSGVSVTSPHDFQPCCSYKSLLGIPSVASEHHPHQKALAIENLERNSSSGDQPNPINVGSAINLTAFTNTAEINSTKKSSEISISTSSVGILNDDKRLEAATSNDQCSNQPDNGEGEERSKYKHLEEPIEGNSFGKLLITAGVQEASHMQTIRSIIVTGTERERSHKIMSKTLINTTEKPTGDTSDKLLHAERYLHGEALRQQRAASWKYALCCQGLVIPTLNWKDKVAQVLETVSLFVPPRTLITKQRTHVLSNLKSALENPRMTNKEYNLIYAIHLNGKKSQTIPNYSKLPQHKRYISLQRVTARIYLEFLSTLLLRSTAQKRLRQLWDQLTFWFNKSMSRQNYVRYIKVVNTIKVLTRCYERLRKYAIRSVKKSSFRMVSSSFANTAVIRILNVYFQRLVKFSQRGILSRRQSLLGRMRIQVCASYLYKKYFDRLLQWSVISLKMLSLHSLVRNQLLHVYFIKLSHWFRFRNRW